MTSNHFYLSKAAICPNTWDFRHITWLHSTPVLFSINENDHWVWELWATMCEEFLTVHGTHSLFSMSKLFPWPSAEFQNPVLAPWSTYCVSYLTWDVLHVLFHLILKQPYLTDKKKSKIKGGNQPKGKPPVTVSAGVQKASAMNTFSYRWPPLSVPKHADGQQELLPIFKRKSTWAQEGY